MRNFKPRNLLLVLALVLALILLAVIALRYRTESQLKSLVKALPKGIDVSLQDIDYTHLEQGRARWRLVAQQVERQSTSGRLALVGPRLIFFEEQGGEKGSLKAGRGELSNDYQQVRLRDDVVLENPAGYSLYTDSLDYNHATQMITTESHVRMISENVHLEGTGLTFDVERERLQLKANVKGLLESRQKK